MAARAAQSTSLSDEPALVRRCVAGDRAGWDELVVRFGRLVYAVIVRTLRRHEVAPDGRVDELFSAGFLALADGDARRLRQWDGRCTLASWVRLVTASTVLDTLRAERRLLARQGEVADVDGLPLDDAGALERAVSAERLARLERAMGTLAEGDRELLRLLYMEDVPPGEVASRLGVQAGAVYTRKNRALERLRAAWHAAEPEDV